MLGEIYLVVKIQAPLVKNEDDEWDFSAAAWGNATKLYEATKILGAQLPNISVQMLGFKGQGYRLGKD